MKEFCYLLLRGVMAPVLALGFVWEVLSSFFAYGAYRGNRFVFWLSNSGKRAKERRSAALALAEKNFPGMSYEYNEEQGCVLVRDPNDKSRLN